MDCSTLLSAVLTAGAEEAETATQETCVPIDWIWTQITGLGVLEALTFISFGVVCLFYGWRVFKILVVICFAMLGLAMGVVVNNLAAADQGPLLGILGAIVMAIVSVPLMRWAVSVLGAIAGGAITAGLWYSAGLMEQYIWVGGLVGVVAGGMISFIVFRIAVMLFSSLGGSALVVMGILALLYRHAGAAEGIKEIIFSERWFLPAVLILPTVLGLYIQNKFIKVSHEWSV